MSSKDFRVGINGEKVVLLVTGKRGIRGYELEPQDAIRIATYMLDGANEIITGEPMGFNEEAAE